MRPSGSTQLVAILLVCLAGSGSLSCYKRYVRAHVEACPPMSEAVVVEMTVVDSPLVTYVADEIIPYCKGIDAVLE